MILKLIIQIVIWLLFVVAVYKNVTAGRQKRGKIFFTFLARMISLLSVILGFVTPLPIYPFLIASIILLFVDYRFRMVQTEMGVDERV